MPKQRAQLLDAVTATNGVPSAATAGIEVNTLGYGGKGPTACSFILKSTAGSGTMTVTIKMWGYDTTVAVWVPLGTNATAASKGLLNEGNAITEHAADVLRHAEPLDLPNHFDRLYAEVTAIGGTGTAVSAWLVAEVT